APGGPPPSPAGDRTGGPGPPARPRGSPNRTHHWTRAGRPAAAAPPPVPARRLPRGPTGRSGLRLRPPGTAGNSSRPAWSVWSSPPAGAGPSPVPAEHGAGGRGSPPHSPGIAVHQADSWGPSCPPAAPAPPPPPAPPRAAAPKLSPPPPTRTGER